MATYALTSKGMAKNPYDLIIIDPSANDYGGLTIVERALETNNDNIFLVVTSNQNQKIAELLSLVQEKGSVAEYLQKPFEEDALVKKVREMLGK